MVVWVLTASLLTFTFDHTLYIDNLYFRPRKVPGLTDMFAGMPWQVTYSHIYSHKQNTQKCTFCSHVI